MIRTWLIAGGLAFLVLIVGTCFQGAGAAPRTTPEQVIQIKLRDLLDMVPRKDAAEVLLRLKAIEERLAAIEAHLKGTPVPLPALGGPK